MDTRRFTLDTTLILLIGALVAFTRARTESATSRKKEFCHA
jgi:hypothetical protein